MRKNKMYTRVVDNNWSFKTADTKEFTHCYHTYPAMMIPQIARKLICDYKPKGKFNLLFDPYMGSGTSLVEALLVGVNCIGTDINPLARLISKSKTTYFNVQEIESLLSDIQMFEFTYESSKVINKDFSRMSNYTFWYSEECLLKLSFISQFINKLNSEIELFFNIALSEVVRECSFTRNSEFKRFKMSKKQLENFNPNVFKLFENKIVRNLKGLKHFVENKNNVAIQIADFNTVYSIPNNILHKDSVDMVVTSPPYGDSRTTVAYGQFSRWANEWFGFENAKKY